MSHVSVMPLRKALATNSTATSFTAKIPKVTAPTGTGVFNLTDIANAVGSPSRTPERILLLPYGGNASNDIFNMRLWGWIETYGPETSDVVGYVPVLLAELACTLGNHDASAVLGTNMLMVDTIAVTDGDVAERTFGVTICSPEAELTAHALIHTLGCKYIEFDFDMDTGGDAANCLWRAVHSY